MGIKVLLVDDEKLERTLIRKGYEWEENGFEIVGEAGSANESIEYVTQKNPDIVITDINMPGIDGLELSKKILEISPNCHIVIVTGYREFEYARKAVKIGAEDFLLKPVNIQDIDNVVNRIKNKIENSRQQKNEVEELKASMLGVQDIVMESFFQNLIENKVQKSEATKKLEIYGCKKLQENCVCVNIKIRESHNYNLDYTKEICDYIKNREIKNTVRFVYCMHNIIVYFMENTSKNAIELADQIYKRFGKKVSVTIGISDVNYGYEGIKNAYDESKRTRQCNKVVEEALTYIDNNLFKPELSLKKVADSIYSNESYLSRIFKKEMSISLIEYITKNRIEASMEMLTSSDMMAYEIAEKVGFRDSHYFSICFKKQTGMTIKEYKSSN